MSKLLLGSISICLDGDPRNESRIKTHQQQLRWLESVGFTNYIYYRVEQKYTSEFREAVSTTLNLESLVFEKGLGPSGARNQLLHKLYESDSDWLICMDDDRDLYQHYGANEFLRDLAVNPATVNLAKEGVLVVGVCPARRPFKKNNTAFGKIDTHWNLTKACIDGCLQICCIPNLVKYGYKPIYFDEDNDAMYGKLPEDFQFEIDWISAKHPMALNLMMVVRDIVPESEPVSTIYATPEIRQAVIESREGMVDAYVKKKTHNRIHDLNTFNRLKNGFKARGIPRLTPYTPVQSDYGKYKIL